MCDLAAKSGEHAGHFQIEMTPEMIRAGADACRWVEDLEGGFRSAEDIAKAVFEAMLRSHFEILRAKRSTMRDR